MGVDLVIESTGRYTDANQAKAHIEAGAKKVIISAPAKNHDATIVMGVNEGVLRSQARQHHLQRLLHDKLPRSCARSSRNKFSVKGLMNTIHAYTNDQKTLDFPHKNLSRGRAAALSIIPTSTGAAKAISEVMPELTGKLSGFALRVPTPDVSVVDLTVVLEKPATVDEVNAAMKEAAKTLKEYSVRPEGLVSHGLRRRYRFVDIRADAHHVYGRQNDKALSWCDNDWIQPWGARYRRHL